MFTPPPSPLPRPNDLDPMDETTIVVGGASKDKSEVRSGEDVWAEDARKRRWKRRLGIIIPLVLFILTASTHYLVYPKFSVSMFNANDHDSHVLSSQSHQASHHHHHHIHQQKRQEVVTTAPSISATATELSVSNAGTPTATVAVTAQPIPMVPSSPPVLPNPFPQPWDSDIGQNYSTTSCFNYFLNMTNTQPFRSCRPFGMLLQSSGQFLRAQKNLTTLNSILWGTCNTNTPYTTCISNIDSFIDGLRSQCATEINERNLNVLNTLIAMQSFPLMHKAGCQVDPSTNTYCYLNAIHNSNPADLYLYQLPLGIDFGRVTPTCSGCGSTLLSIYADALQSGTGDDQLILGNEALAVLKKTYSGAAQANVNECGKSYATALGSANAALRNIWQSSWTWTILGGTILVWMNIV